MAGTGNSLADSQSRNGLKRGGCSGGLTEVEADPVYGCPVLFRARSAWRRRGTTSRRTDIAPPSLGNVFMGPSGEPTALGAMGTRGDLI